VDLAEGTVNSSFVSPREEVEAALKHNAVSLIFAHNHPSGNPAPSQSDKEVTLDMVFAAAIMKLKVLDHLIIGDNRYFSFAGEGLIEQYELPYLNLKIHGGSETTRRTNVAEGKGELPW
jgi:DNA repair protein RadC